MSMVEIKAPGTIPSNAYTVFLAGSIEMGAATNWQTWLVDHISKLSLEVDGTGDSKGEHVAVLNPRRDDWDSSWLQDINDPKFSEQVNWELSSIEDANTVIFYFDPATKSPITLMELGFVAGLRMAGADQNLIVCCPPGFWRKGNVDIICERAEITIVESFEELLEAI